MFLQHHFVVRLLSAAFSPILTNFSMLGEHLPSIGDLFERISFLQMFKLCVIYFPFFFYD